MDEKKLDLNNVDLNRILNESSVFKKNSEVNTMRHVETIQMSQVEFTEIIKDKMSVVSRDVKTYDKKKRIFDELNQYESLKDIVTEEEYDNRLHMAYELVSMFMVLTGTIKQIKTDINDLATMLKKQYVYIERYDKDLTEYINMYRQESSLLNQTCSTIKYLKESKFRKKDELNIVDFSKSI